MYERFMQLLQEKNITAYRVSKETGVTQTTLSDWKTGRGTPKTATLQKIADYFSVSLDWLTGKSKYRNENEGIEYNWGYSNEYFTAAFDFCGLLEDIREEQGVSVSEMAEVIGITQQDYIDCEDGIKPITYEQAEKLCEYLGTNTSQVFFDNNYYDEEVPEAYHNDVRKWELLKRQDELDRIVSSKYPDFVKGKNYLPSGKCMDVSDYMVLEKYHALDPHGTKIVDFVLNEEYERCIQSADKSKLSDDGIIETPKGRYKVAHAAAFGGGAMDILIPADVSYDEINRLIDENKALQRQKENQKVAEELKEIIKRNK